MQGTPHDDLHVELDDLAAQLEVAQRTYDGALNLLQVFEEEEEEDEAKEELKRQVAAELQTAGQRITDLQEQIDAVQTRLSAQIVGNQSENDLSHTEDAHEDEDEFRRLADDFLRDLAEQPESEALNRMETLTGMMRRSNSVSLLPVELAATCLLPLLSDVSPISVRASAYRLLRHFMASEFAVDELRKRHFDIYLIKTLSRDARHDLEKQQAVRTVRHILQYPGRTSAAVVKAIVAVAENGEDKLRLVCLELLAELVICDIDLLCKADGLRIVLQALADGPYEISPTLASLFLYLVDTPRLRAFLRPGTDIEMALDGLSEMPGKGHHFAEKTRASVQIVLMLLKSWSGLLFLYSENKMAIPSLVQCLYLPAAPVCDIILDTLFDLFRVNTSSWLEEYLSGKRLTMFRRMKQGKRDQTNQEAEMAAQTGQTNQRATLVDQYLGLVLLIFVEAGLLEALVYLAENNKEASLARKSAMLIGEVLYLSNRILPLEFVSRLQALPRLFALASAFTEDMSRLAATTALQSVDSFARNMARLHGHESSTQATGELRTRSISIDDPLQRGQRAVEASKIKQGLQIDDTAFRNLLVDTQVLTAPKEEQKWHIEALQELFEGPLMNVSRFDEVNKGSKFLRRLMTFFHPLEGRFSDLPRNQKNERWSKLLMTILETMLSQTEGIRFLLGDKLLKQISDALLTLNPMINNYTSEAFFSRKRLVSTMSYAYFEVVGRLTRSKEGIELLERFHLVSGLCLVADMKSREDITRTILESMSYEIDGHMRVLLSKILTSSKSGVRFYATRRLGKMLQETESSDVDWMILLLVTQLYDPAEGVRDLAIELIDEACSRADRLESVVNLRPSLDHLGDRGAPLLFRFLASSVGLRYLHQIGYVDRELEDWYVRGNAIYARHLELRLAHFLGMSKTRHGHNDHDPRQPGAVPPHFYGELVKTPEGQIILRHKGHFNKFSSYIRKYGTEDEGAVRLSTLKSILWAVGNIGASPEGVAFLEEEDLVAEIVKIAETSRCYSVRGTCFYVLGLIASSLRGSELLGEQGWVAASSPLGEPLGICIPAEVSNFLCVPSTQGRAYDGEIEPRQFSARTHTEREAVYAMANLTNHLLTHKSSKTLARLRSRQGEIFASPELFCHALRLMETLHLRLPARRFIFDLFTLPLTPENLDKVVQADEALRSRELHLNGDSMQTPRPISPWALGQGGADFSDEEEGIQNTVPRQQLAPQAIIRGFAAA